MSDNSYIKLAAINVNEHVEKKGNLSYLSWAWAVDQLLRQDPAANWEYGEPIVYADGTMMVVCTVTAFGVPRRMQLPVMDHRNRAIANPDAFQVNTAMQRCLVKAIALHGLGLYIYAGEDLPEGEKAEGDDAPKRPNTATQVAKDEFDSMPPEAQKVLQEWALEAIAFVEDGKPSEAAQLLKDRCESHEDKLAAWSLLPSNVRSAIKKAEQLKRVA